MLGRDVILFAILVVLFGGFLSVGGGMAFDPDTGFWIMIVGLIVGMLGLTASVSDGLSE